MKWHSVLFPMILALGVGACAHGVPVPPHPRLLHDFYFYPSVGVYYHIAGGYYYYSDGDAWIKVKVLPPRFRIGPRDRVHLRHKSLRPYDKHAEHKKRYREERRRKPDEAQNRREREENIKRHRRHKKQRR